MNSHRLELIGRADPSDLENAGIELTEELVKSLFGDDHEIRLGLFRDINFDPMRLIAVKDGKAVLVGYSSDDGEEMPFAQVYKILVKDSAILNSVSLIITEALKQGVAEGISRTEFKVMHKIFDFFEFTSKEVEYLR